MANNIFNILNKPVANPNKNGFDLSQFFPYSMKMGQVKPIYFLQTVPQGHYKINVDELCHTEPFITDPFVRLSKHIEVVFTPFSQLWHSSSQFFGHANDPQSSYEQGHAFAPNFDLGLMLDRIWKSSTMDMQGLVIRDSALSLLDMLGYGAHPLRGMTDNQVTSYINGLKGRRVNAFPLLAYNKYWNSYLRDSQHTSPLAAKIFNADCVPCTSEETSHMENYYTDAELLELVTIKYRKVKKDLFTSALTSRQFGAVEGVSMSFSGGFSAFDRNTPIGAVDDGRVVGQLQFNTNSQQMLATDGSGIVGHEVDGTVTPLSLIFKNGSAARIYNKYVYADSGFTTLLKDGLSGSASFDVYTLLTAQLMQKWREQIQRAGNRTEDRLRAVYGASPQSDAKNHPYIVGSTSYNIVASQVTSTGSSDSARLADIAAKGQGYSQRNNFEFTASEFGVLTVYTYILPENNYLAPIDKTNSMIEPFDFFVPQVENLGLEQIEGIFRGTAVYYDGKYRGYSHESPGFAARNWAYKTKVNVVHLGFEHGQENSKWMPSRIEFDPNGNFAVNEYYVSPNEYDTVFGTTTDGYLDTDQFICGCNVTCHAVLPMSELGLPRW